MEKFDEVLEDKLIIFCKVFKFSEIKVVGWVKYNVVNVIIVDNIG